MCKINEVANNVEKIQDEIKLYNLTIKEYETIKQIDHNYNTTLSPTKMHWSKALDSLKQR